MRAWSACLVLSCLAAGSCTAVLAAPGTAGAGSVSASAGQPRITTVVPQPAASAFRVLSVAELRRATKKMTAASVRTRAVRAEQAPAPSTAARAGLVRPETPQPYASGSGIVLDARRPLDAATGSSLVVSGVLYSSTVVYDLVYGHEDLTLSQEVPNRPWWDALTASFRKLPAGQHTYLLTLGHTADPKYVTIRINGEDFTGDQLAHNPASSEIRLLVTYDAAASGDLMNAMVYLSYPESAPWGFQTFHHIQLAVLD